MSDKEGSGQAGKSGISTRLELEKRLSERASPESVPHLYPDTASRLQALRDSAKTNEQRIAELRQSLEGASQKLETDMTFAQLEGRAKQDFDRSR